MVPFHLPSASNRREFLSRCAAIGVSAYGLAPARGSRSRLRAYPFTLGVASGDPTPQGVVLWTRLAPEPLAPGGGLGPQTVTVRWEIAQDENFARVVLRGDVIATPQLAHAVHAEVGGLQPDRVYWYRFLAGGESSPVGRTRTAPLATVLPEEFPFAFASCQHYEQGYFTALRHLANEDVRFVAHLGDYIYENGGMPDRPRRHEGAEIMTLEEYRLRYALYKLDADLQAAHAALPWITTWDDHEVDNNYAGDRDERGSPPPEFLRRRAAAYQAYYEHMPLRRSARPDGPAARLYRRLRFGRLLDLHVLDGRQYRTDQPCGDGRKPQCAEAFDTRATMLGRAQEAWLEDGLSQSNARWNAIANQVPLSQIDNEPGEDASYSMDRWDGYPAARTRLLHFLRVRRPGNPVVLTGDTHFNLAGELKPQFGDPGSPVVGVEFIGTSLSSGGDGADSADFGQRFLAANPDLKFFNNQRGYIRCLLTPRDWRADYRVLEYVSRPGAPITTRASFIVQNGRSGLLAG
jgi:alkaline phosphatase D